MVVDPMREDFVMVRKSVLGLAVVMSMSLPGCRKKPRDVQAEVTEMVLHLESLLEKRDLRELKPLIASDYRDVRGQTKPEVIRFLQFQFLKRRTIGLVLHIRSIDFTTPPTEATVSILVGAGSTPVTDFKQLSGLSADLFDVVLTVVDDDGTWRVGNASWKRMRFQQLESLLGTFTP